MNAKHQFKYTYNDTDLEEYSPIEVTFEIPATATIPQMLRNFEQYLRACGYFFDGTLDIVQDSYDIIDEFENEEPSYGCMVDFDKKCGCPVGPKGEEGSVGRASDLLNEWNESIAKLDNEQKQKCREESLKMSGLHHEATKGKKNMDYYKEAIKEAEDKYPVNPLYKKVGTLELDKNNWVHGMCNPPASDHSNCCKNK